MHNRPTCREVRQEELLNYCEDIGLEKLLLLSFIYFSLFLLFFTIIIFSLVCIYSLLLLLVLITNGIIIIVFLYNNPL